MKQKSSISFSVKKAKRNFVKWSLLTKFDCYSKIFETKNVLVKFVWLGLFLFFSGITVFFVAKNIADFNVYETVSKIEIINEKPMEFPVITICNANPYTSLTAKELISNITIFNYGKTFDSFDSWSMIDNYATVYELVRLHTNRQEYGDANRKLLGNEIVIKKCLFNNEPCSIENDFTWHFSYFYGNCKQFNRGLNISNVYQTKTEGPVFGLSLVMLKPRNQNTYPTLTGQGFKLFIHNKSFEPIVPEEVNLEMGKEIDVVIGRTLSIKIPEPYSECIDLTGFSSKLQQKLKDSNKTYRQYDCFRLCLQQRINEECKCYFSRYLKVSKEYPACLNLTQLACIYLQQDQFLPNQECKEQCPLECDTVTYFIETSSLQYPSITLYKKALNSSNFVESFQNYTGETFSMSSMQEHVMSLKVYYPYNRFTLISESPKIGFYDLLAQIGGSMGMLLGFSIFHLIEVLEVVILVIWSMFS